MGSIPDIPPFRYCYERVVFTGLCTESCWCMMIGSQWWTEIALIQDTKKKQNNYTDPLYFKCCCKIWLAEPPTLSWLQQLTHISDSRGKSYFSSTWYGPSHMVTPLCFHTLCWTWTRGCYITGCERKEAFWEERGAQSCEDIECFLVRYWEVVSGGSDYRELILICQVSHEQTIDEGDAIQRSWCSFLRRRGKTPQKMTLKIFCLHSKNI